MRKRMRKRITVIVMTLVLSVSVLAGCGELSREDYENDIDVFIDLAGVLEDSIYDYSSASKDLDIIKSAKIKTPEGNAIISDLYNEVELIQIRYKTETQDEWYAIERELGDLEHAQKDNIEAFIKAAARKDVNDRDLNEFEGACGAFFNVIGEPSRGDSSEGHFGY